MNFEARLSPAEFNKIFGVLQQYASDLDTRYGPEKIARDVIESAIDIMERAIETIESHFDSLQERDPWRARVVFKICFWLMEETSDLSKQCTETTLCASWKVKLAAMAMYDVS